MGYVIINMIKVKNSGVASIQRHNERKNMSENQNIDTTRSHLNYEIVKCDNYLKTIKEKIEQLVVSKKAIRKDAVLCCNFIVTASQESISRFHEKEKNEFFQDSVVYFQNRYGIDRVINATVHLDTRTPHVHISVVPITLDGRLSAKDMFNKIELTNIQTDFANKVGKRYSLRRGNENSKNKHIDEINLKIRKQEEKLKKKQKELKELNSEYALVETEYMEICHDYNAFRERQEQEIIYIDQLISLSKEMLNVIEKSEENEYRVCLLKQQLEKICSEIEYKPFYLKRYKKF